MRIAPSFACFYVAIDSALRAMGEREQTVFSDSHLWVWWVFSVLWIIIGMRTLLEDNS